MRTFVVAISTVALLLVALLRAEARIVVNVDKSTQRMSVSVDGVARYIWEVSTGRENFGTPGGVYRPQLLERSHFSRKYYNSPMPYSIFFHRGYAIHGSYEISKLGGPASHGCIRLHPENAAKLFSLVQQHGLSSTTIIVSGNNPLYGKRLNSLAAKNRRVVETGVAPSYERNSYRSSTRNFIYEDDDWGRWGRGGR